MAEQPTPPEHLLTSAEVAALVFVDPKTVSRWAQAGKIPCVRTPGGHRRFRTSDVQAILRRGRGEDQLHHETVSPPLNNGGVERGGMAAAGDTDRTGVDAAVAEAVAIALEVQADVAEAVLERAAPAAFVAETTASAAMKARRARTLAIAETAEVKKQGEGLATETARAQRLAVRVGVATATLGAVLGGFAGAVAARVAGI
jgi:excisionase family DNA binding protein